MKGGYPVNVAVSRRDHKKTLAQQARRRMKRMTPLYIALLPSFLLTFVFAYLPMFGNVIAFMKYDPFKGFMGFESPWVGFANFSFVNDRKFWDLAWRTVWYSVNGLIFGFPSSFILALLINELRSLKYKRIIQTISYIPHFVSWITIASLIYIFLSIDEYGLLNNILQALFGAERVSFMMYHENFLPILIISGIWKGVGWGTIVYLASISGIDPTLYEAAQIDGAGRWKQCRHITLPSIIPTTCILLIFSIGGLFSSNFDQIFALQNDVIRNQTNTINVYAYYVGLQGRRYALATAVGLFQGFIAFILIRGSNYISKRFANIGFF